MSPQMGLTSSEMHKRSSTRKTNCCRYKRSPNISSCTRSLSVLGGRSCGIMHWITAPVIKGMKNLAYPDHSLSKCPPCDTADLDKPTLGEHVITNHTKSDNSWCTLLDYHGPHLLQSCVMLLTCSLTSSLTLSVNMSCLGGPIQHEL